MLRIPNSRRAFPLLGMRGHGEKRGCCLSLERAGMEAWGCRTGAVVLDRQPHPTCLLLSSIPPGPPTEAGRPDHRGQPPCPEQAREGAGMDGDCEAGKEG